MRGDPTANGAILEALWGAPGEHVYAIFDAARDPRVMPALSVSGARTACLYEGRIPPEIAAVAPYLVKLSRDDELSTTLLLGAWGKSWGIFARSPHDFEAVRRHFRKFLRVTDEAGKHLLFRFYDPRVLRAYLPTCRATELEAFFGPVTTYVAEGDKESWLNTYRVQNGLYTMGRVVLDSLARAPLSPTRSSTDAE